jgi:hypothetical protein
MASMVMSERKASDRWIVADREQFREKFNRQSFVVSHYLATHWLFQLTALMELADRTLKTRPHDLRSLRQV